MYSYGRVPASAWAHTQQCLACQAARHDRIPKRDHGPVPIALSNTGGLPLGRPPVHRSMPHREGF